MEEITTVTPKELASRVGTSPKKVRSMLRNSIDRNTKHKSWQVTPEQAQQVNVEEASHNDEKKPSS